MFENLVPVLEEGLALDEPYIHPDWDPETGVAYVFHYTHREERKPHPDWPNWRGTTKECVEWYLSGEADPTYVPFFDYGIGGPEVKAWLSSGALRVRKARRRQWRREKLRGCAIVNYLQFVFPHGHFETIPAHFYHESEPAFRYHVDYLRTKRLIFSGVKHWRPGQVEAFAGSEAIARDQLSLHYRPDELRIRTLDHASQWHWLSDAAREEYFRNIREADLFVRGVES